MKNQKTTIICLCVVFIALLSSCNRYFSSAMSDIKKNNITSTTVSNLEKSKSNKKKTVESYYQLARIYHYNQQFQNLDKAKEYYQYLISNNNKDNLKSQYEKLRKQYSVNKYSLESGLKNVNELIDTRTFNSYIKVNTLDGYKEFVSLYPKSNHITDAKNKAFDKAVALNTFDGYKKYITLFPDHKNTEAINKAFVIATDLNTIADYKNYAEIFNNHRISEIYLLALKVAFDSNSIELLDEYIATFPKSPKINEAIYQRNYLVFERYINRDEHKKLDYKGKIIDIDKLLLNNKNTTVLNTDISNYILSILPKYRNIQEFSDVNKTIQSANIRNPFLQQVLTSYIDESLANSIELTDLPTNFTNFDEMGACSTCRGSGKSTCSSCIKGKVKCSRCGGSGKVTASSGWGTETRDCGTCNGTGRSTCSSCDGSQKVVCKTCNGSGKPAKQKEDSNFKLASIVDKLNNRIKHCDYILSNFPNASSGIRGLVNDRKQRDLLFMEYYPIKAFHDNISTQQYNETLFRAKLAEIQKIQNNSNYSKLANWPLVNSVLTTTSRKINEQINSDIRKKQIAANSVVNKWRLGNGVCKTVYNGIIYGQIDQFNEDKSSIKIKIIAGPAGEYQGEPIKQGNMIWDSPNNGWHLCLDDEKSSSLANNQSKVKEEPKVVYKEPTYSGPKICKSCTGRGTQVCASCNGTGVTGWDKDKRCSSCGGRGSYRCSSCGGRGSY